MTTTNTTHSTSRSGSDIIPDSEVELTFPWRHSSLTLDDVGGLEEIKAELERTVIRPLGPRRAEYERFGVAGPNILFEGPPGTGKTYTARALAGELGYPFVVMTSGRLQSRWVNESTDHVQRLFREAALIADRHGYAVIFADELDTILPRRDGNDKHQEDNKVVTEMLGYLDRCQEHNTLFIGATNRPDELDSAAVRHGRIDRKFSFPLPDKPTRAAIIDKQLAGRPTHLSATHIDTLAEATNGFSAATLASIVEEAARLAVEQEAPAIEASHLNRVVQHLSDSTE